MVYFNVIYVIEDPLPPADSVVLLVELIIQLCDRGRGVDVIIFQEIPLILTKIVGSANTCVGEQKA